MGDFSDAYLLQLHNLEAKANTLKHILKPCYYKLKSRVIQDTIYSWRIEISWLWKQVSLPKIQMSEWVLDCLLSLAPSKEQQSRLYTQLMQLTWVDKVRCDEPGLWLLRFWHIKKWYDLYLLFLLGANLKRVRQSVYKEHSFETISDLVRVSGFQFYLLWYIPCLSLHSLSYDPPQKRIWHSTKQGSWKMEINTWFLTL